MLGAEIEHLLGLADAADAGAGDAARRFGSRPKTVDRQRFFRRADQSQRAVALQQLEIGVEVVLAPKPCRG